MDEAIDYDIFLSLENLRNKDNIDYNKQIKDQLFVIESVFEEMTCRKNILNYLDCEFLLKAGV